MATNKPSAGRVAAHRAKLREQGLRPLEIWAAPEHHPAIKEFAADFQNTDQNQEAQQPQQEPVR